ncbi:hypothetical protein R3P38DRAFT_2787527 [Favolaschia claudopus]|uniref:Uncharacterized protein n=1 Tax=Favolaschia claudopus TaxID=2862362 RepID=A0AAW0AN89_9AGAR
MPEGERALSRREEGGADRRPADAAGPVRSKPVLALFREWDEEIFPESETSLGAVKEMDVGASAGDLNAALDAIRSAEVEEDVEMGGADNTGNAGNGEEEGDEDQY